MESTPSGTVDPRSQRPSHRNHSHFGGDQKNQTENTEIPQPSPAVCSGLVPLCSSACHALVTPRDWSTGRTAPPLRNYLPPFFCPPVLFQPPRPSPFLVSLSLNWPRVFSPWCVVIQGQLGLGGCELLAFTSSSSISHRLLNENNSTAARATRSKQLSQKGTMWVSQEWLLGEVAPWLGMEEILRRTCNVCRAWRYW